MCILCRAWGITRAREGRHNSRGESFGKGKEKGQKEVLELVEKGYSYEEILETLSSKAKTKLC